MSNVISIKEWQEKVHALATEKGWWEKEPNLPEKLVLIHSEISEALEEYRKNDWGVDDIYYHSDNPDKPEGFPIELADTVIRIMDLCGYLGFDLENAIRVKHEYNATRPYRHGGKRC